MTTPSPQWKKTACILCSLNCGLEVQTENGRISKIRGDDDHPASQGYVCEKSQRMDYYQNGADRLDTPMRRRPDGSYEAIDWDTAIREVAEKFLAIKRRHGGESILYYGGGAQGNHLGGAYGDSTLKALGVKYRSNALAQEKTGEFWVQGKMFGTGVHGDFEHCEVAILIGKNPWQSHGFARARVLLNAMAKDPARSIIVIDPRLSETAALADFHLQIRPGTDAWCLAALVGIIVQDGLLARDWLAEHTSGYEHIVDELNAIPVAHCAETCGVAEDKLRAAARRIASASSVSALEDLGMQMNLHSTLGSYLQRLVWLLTGHYGRPGTSNAFVPFLSLSKASKGDTSMGKRGAPRVEKRSPVANAKIIIGLIPCNVIPEEILTDHPKRYRAMLVETGNPLHSLADSQRMREAMRALELSVVIDVAMTETARHADYVLPAASQFEKAEATFFNLEFPRNAFHLRAPLFPARPGTLPEAEIHARLLEAMGVLGEKDYRPLRLALKLGRKAFSAAFLAAAATRPKVMKYAPVLLYRTLGPTLPAGMEAAAAIWGICQLHVLNNRKTAARAGFDGLPPLAADRLFQAMFDNPSGVVFAETTYAESWQAVARPEQRINLHIPELLPELAKLAHSAPPHDPAYPFILAAGERRSDTSNTAVRDTGWHRRGRYGTLRISPQDAEALGCADGEVLRVVTRRGEVEAEVEISDMMQLGNISLPNGQGLDYRNAEGEVVRRGVAPNEVTDCTQRDFLAGTPWHKYVPARLERLATPAATNA
ncbi:molybdopterin oxidoreductase family protein [Pseudomonas aeruginosa]|uniref:molybdopterin oxidoreductase family protein n=1 Tax=Pseudomonas aeruginosa TaxID=287 RepID=UPI0030044CA4